MEVVAVLSYHGEDRVYNGGMQRSIKEKELTALLARGTIDTIYPTKADLVKRLGEKEPFHIYFGIDPTAPNLHLGHVQHLLFLEELRKLGMKVTLLIGDFTGCIGDPSDRASARKQLSRDEVRRNSVSLRKQIVSLLKVGRFSGARMVRNSRWFTLFSAEDMFTLLRGVTVQGLLERKMFQERLRQGKPLYVHEFLYPALQGYDSVALRTDAELCGTDQTFNALVGRDFVKRYLGREKFIVTMKLIEGGGALMSKSAGTGVFVDLDAGGENRMFGSIMALPDTFIMPLIRGCTRIPMPEVLAIEKVLPQGGAVVRDIKLRLAEEVVRLFHPVGAVTAAREAFITQFQKGGVPESTDEVVVNKPTGVLDLVIKHGAVSSGSEARRKIKDGAISVDGQKIIRINFVIQPKKRQVLRIGRRIIVLKKTKA